MVSWWDLAAKAASFVCRTVAPRPVVRVTATAPRTAAPARSSAMIVTWSLYIATDARPTRVRGGRALGEASPKPQ
jgi:hypothetical protein